MKQVARALIAQRKALRFPCAVTVCEETDLGAYGQAYPRITLRVLAEPSSVTAVVPIKVEETVTIASDDAQAPLLDPIVDALIAGCNERPFFGYDATIHSATWGGAKYAAGAMNERRAILTWNLTASWRRR